MYSLNSMNLSVSCTFNHFQDSFNLVLSVSCIHINHSPRSKTWFHGFYALSHYKPISLSGTFTTLENFLHYVSHEHHARKSPSNQNSWTPITKNQPYPSSAHISTKEHQNVRLPFKFERRPERGPRFRASSLMHLAHITRTLTHMCDNIEHTHKARAPVAQLGSLFVHRPPTTRLA